MMPIIIPRLEHPSVASVDERDEHLMLLEAARHALDVEWTETLAAAETAADHHVMGYPSMVAHLKHRMRMAGGRAHRYEDRPGFGEACGHILGLETSSDHG
jgi:hypothetical protein